MKKLRLRRHKVHISKCCFCFFSFMLNPKLPIFNGMFQKFMIIEDDEEEKRRRWRRR